MREPSVDFFCGVLKILGADNGNKVADPIILEDIREKLGEIEWAYKAMKDAPNPDSYTRLQND